MNYECPYCKHHTTVTAPNRSEEWRPIDIAKDHLRTEHWVGLRYKAVACPNPKCKELMLAVSLTKSYRDKSWNMVEDTEIEHWQLLPASSAKPQPSYIPSQLVEDYTEACTIKDLSPKASATLARRCLQGMIRDFWKISLSSLKLEIDALEDKVSLEEWEAIDAVRSVGNIGAHFEKDVDVIVEIEPDEAELLIGLIEDLFVDWYVVRHERKVRQERMKKLAESKADARKSAASKTDAASSKAPS